MKRKKTKKWVRVRHKVAFWLARGILTPFFRIKYGYKRGNDTKKLPSPCMIMCNHQTTMDQCYLIVNIHKPLYFVASEDLFSIPIVSRIIRFVAEPISKTKSKSDFSTIRNSLKVLSEGGNVCVFPSGNRSLSGGEWEIDVAAAKFAKLCKVPLVLYNIKGGYGLDPRWGVGIRKGKLRVEIQKIISAEELAKMPVEELHELIKKTLDAKDYESGEKYTSKRRAEHIERALYYCPDCKSFNTLRSEKNHVFCTKCGMTAEYAEDLKLKAEKGTILGETVKEWYDKQWEILKGVELDGQTTLFSDKVEARLIVGRKREKLRSATMWADGVGIKVKTKAEEYSLDFSKKITTTILGKRKINFYLSDDTVLQVKGDERFNSIKYLHLNEIAKEKF